MATQTHERLDDPALRPWLIDSADFPTGDPLSEAITFCLNYAVLAPSGHNTQPWWFSVEGSTVTIGLDTSRGLAVLDPEDREGIISVGAAVFHLRIALAHFGFATTTTYWPDPLDPEACVRLEVTDTEAVTPELEPLFEAIPRRHTSRAAFAVHRVPQPVQDALVADAVAEGAMLHLATDYPTRHALAELVSRADRRQLADRSFRRELAAWLRSARGRRADGIRGYGSDVHQLMSFATPLIVRTFDVGDGRAAADVDLTTGSPLLGVLSTSADDRTDWLRAGQALARVLLRATAANLNVGFLDQPIEVADLRSKVTAAVGVDGVAQVLLRLGYGPPAVPQPRRPLADVLETR